MTICATWKGTVIAESDRTIVLEGRHYFPVADLKWEFFEASSHHTICSWKGQASYFSVGGQANVVWSYEQPIDAAAAIAGHLAFYPAVTVEKV